MSSSIAGLVRAVRKEGLPFLTLNTGHVLHTVAGDVPQSTIDALLTVIEAGKARARVPMPTAERSHHLRMRFTPTGMLVTIVAGAHDSFGPGYTAVTFGVSVSPQDDRPLYRDLTDNELVLPQLKKWSPAKPFLAARVEPLGFLMSTVDVVMTFADFERCMAWAFIEHLDRSALQTAV